MISAAAMWAIFFGYLVLLGALVLLTVKGDEPMRRTVWTLIAVTAFGFLFQYVIATDWRYSAYMILVNALACWLITMHPASRWQALIGWSFVIQIGSDVGRVAVEINGGTSDMFLLYWETTALAYLQLLFVIGWGTDGLLRHNCWGRSHPTPAPSHISGMA